MTSRPLRRRGGTWSTTCSGLSPRQLAPREESEIMFHKPDRGAEELVVTLASQPASQRGHGYTTVVRLSAPRCSISCEMEKLLELRFQRKRNVINYHSLCLRVKVEITNTYFSAANKSGCSSRFRTVFVFHSFCAVGENCSVRFTFV